MSRRATIGFVTALFLAAAPAAQACGSTGYSYAGVTSRDAVHGVGATITTLGSPNVQNGHVAGWVGVGGPGLGPHGTSEWIQVGYSGFPGLTVGSLYYEVALPGRAPQYHELLSTVPSGATHRVAVLEVSRHSGWWRVWVDGHRASPAYRLPGSTGSWKGVATAESWGGGMRACNKYAYHFRRVIVARHAGGSWHPMNVVYRMHQGDNHLVGASPINFVVRTTTLPRSSEPSFSTRKPRPVDASAAKTAAAVTATPVAAAAAPPPQAPDPAAVSTAVDAASTDPEPTGPGTSP